MLRLHFVQQGFKLLDSAMAETLYAAPMFREFAGLDTGQDNVPAERTIWRLRHGLEAHNLALPILATVNATLRWRSALRPSRERPRGANSGTSA